MTSILLNYLSTFWGEAHLITYGRYPSDFNIDFSRLFRDTTLAQDLYISIDNVASVNPRLDMTPINFTLNGTRVYSRPLWNDLTTHVLYLGDALNSADWLAFWNLRAFGMDILFIPINHVPHFASLIRDLFEEGNYPLSETYQNYTLLQKSPSLSSDQFAQAIDEVKAYNPVGFELHTREWLPNLRPAYHPWMGESHGPPPLESAIVIAAEQYDLLQFLDDRLEFKLINPHFASFIHPTESKRWAVSLSSYQTPASDHWISLPWASPQKVDR